MDAKTRKPLSDSQVLNAVIWSFLIFLLIKEALFPPRGRRPKAYE